MPLAGGFLTSVDGATHAGTTHDTTDVTSSQDRRWGFEQLSSFGATQLVVQATATLTASRAALQLFAAGEGGSVGTATFALGASGCDQ